MQRKNSLFDLYKKAKEKREQKSRENKSEKNGDTLTQSVSIIDDIDNNNDESQHVIIASHCSTIEDKSIITMAKTLCANSINDTTSILTNY